MERLIWQTPDGRTLHKAHVDDHHIFWERKAYRTRLERLVRGMGGAVLRLDRQAHQDLHHELPPPPKPNFHLMSAIYHHARTPGYETQYDLFHQIVDYVGLVATTSQNQLHVEDASLLHAHLLGQTVFIEQGRLTPLEGRVA